jgi:hypothetical protein
MSDRAPDRRPALPPAGLGVIWPDLGSTRITAITASQGFPPEAEDASDADVFD